MEDERLPEHYRPSPRVLEPKADQVAELGSVRRRDLVGLSQRLQRVEAPPRGRWFLVVAQLLLGAALGSAVAGIPLLSSTVDLDAWVRPTYIAATAACVVLAVVCFLAYRSTREQRADSITAIKEDLDGLLAAYEPLPSESPPARSVSPRLRSVLRLLRDEARDNHTLMRQAEERGEYWKVMSEDAPQTSAWKKHRGLLADDPSYEDLYQRGRRACQGVERVLQARSVRLFRPKAKRRKVEAQDRLPEIIRDLGLFDEALSDALTRLDQGAS